MVTTTEREWARLRAMVQSGRQSDRPDGEFWSWLLFWLQFLLLAFCIVLGAVAASDAEQDGDYATGMVLILASIALFFLILKRSFDEPSAGLGDFMLVEKMVSLAIVIPLFIIIGLSGLFIAQGWPHGSLHSAGIALFVVSGVIVFLDIKRVFDRLD